MLRSTCDIDACVHLKCGYHKCNIIFLTRWLKFLSNTPMLRKLQWCISFRMCGIGRKTLRRRYTINARQKSRKKLAEWINHIKNHQWHSSTTCGGDADRLVKSVKSMPLHICNIQGFNGHQLYTRCEHEPVEKWDIITISFINPWLPFGIWVSAHNMDLWWIR